MISLVPLMLLAQVDMTPQLEKGPLVLVEETKGKFTQASSMVLVDAPPEQVWEIVKAQAKFKDFVPKVLESEMKPQGTDHEVHFVIEVPGPDTDYAIRYTIDDAARSMSGAWAKGDLKGSRWVWKVEAAPGSKTLLTHSIALKNFSGIAQSLEDDNQTITVGVNVSAALAVTKAVKKRAEAVRAAAAETGSK
jgi:ribosome-associated toxin RatA of RatAB toxin-antitoxin module